MKQKILKSFRTGNWLLSLLVIVSAWHYYKVFEETLPVFIAIPMGLLVDLLLYFIVRYGMKHLTFGGVTWSLIMTGISYLIYYTFYSLYEETLPLKTILGQDSKLFYAAIFPLIIMACSWYFPKREKELADETGETGEAADSEKEPEIKSLGDVFRLADKTKKKSGTSSETEAKPERNDEQNQSEKVSETSSENGAKPERKRRKKRKRQESNTLYPCPYCGKEFSKPAGMNGHLAHCPKKGAKNEPL